MGKIEEKILDTTSVHDRMLSNQQYLQKILQMTSDTLIVLDRQNKCVDLLLKTENPIFNSEKSIIGHDFLDLLPEETASLVKVELDKTRELGISSNANYDLPTEEMMYYFKLMVHKFDDEHLLCQYRDITNRSNMKRRLKSKAKALMEVGKVAKISHWSYDPIAEAISYPVYSSSDDDFLPKYEVTSLVDSLLPIHADDKVIVKDFLTNPSKEATTIEYRIIKDNSEVEYIRSTRYARANDNEVISGFRQVVTDLLRNRHELELIVSIVNDSDRRVIAAKCNGEVIFMNKLSRSFAGIKEKASLEGVNIKNLIEVLSSGDNWMSLIERLKHSKDGLLFRIDTPCPDHNVLALECHASIIKNWEGEDIIWLFQEDISDRIRYEEQLLKSKATAEESEKLKMAFISNMNHEIRTPLGAIIGLSMLIADEEDASLRNEYSKLVTSNSDQLLRLITDVLEMSKLDSGGVRLTIKSESMHSIFQDVELGFRHEENRAKLLVSMPVEDTIAELDKGRLTQLLTNLINNARKFTDPSGLIEVGYSVENSLIELFVKDNGIGIPQDKQDHVFDRFYKVNESDQGSGLGLAICKSIVEQMNGKINLESAEGKGTTFRISIPLITTDEK